MSWHKAADVVRWHIQPFIGGRYRASRSTDRVDNINPGTESVLCGVPVGDPADVDDAVHAARCAFTSGCWSRLTPTRRMEILLRLAELIVQRAPDLALLDSLEMGKPIRAALFDAEHFAPERLRSWAGFADKLLGAAAPLTPGFWYSTSTNLVVS